MFHAQVNQPILSVDPYVFQTRTMKDADQPRSFAATDAHL